jgi:p-aminobenzoyl-glutamate transporter AbgT
MTLRTIRRRLGQATAGHDWLAGAVTALGVVFAALAVVCAVAVVTAIASLGDEDHAFGASIGFLQSARWFAVVFFGVLAIVFGAVAWVLAGDAVRRAGRRLRGRA